jgi:hypothetical protein
MRSVVYCIKLVIELGDISFLVALGDMACQVDELGGISSLFHELGGIACVVGELDDISPSSMTNLIQYTTERIKKT